MKKLIHIYLFLITSHAVFAQENQPASTPFPSQSNQPILTALKNDYFLEEMLALGLVQLPM